MFSIHSIQEHLELLTLTDKTLTPLFAYQTKQKQLVTDNKNISLTTGRSSEFNLVNFLFVTQR